MSGWGDEPTTSSGGWGDVQAKSPPKSSGGWDSSPVRSTPAAKPGPAAKSTSGGWGDDSAPKASGAWGDEPAAKSSGGWGDDSAPKSSGVYARRDNKEDGGYDRRGDGRRGDNEDRGYSRRGDNEDRGGDRRRGGDDSDRPPRRRDGDDSDRPPRRRDGDDDPDRPRGNFGNYDNAGGDGERPVLQSKYEKKENYIDNDISKAGDRSAERNPRLEKELFGDPEAKSTNTGINFDIYDSIPAEVKGDDVPPAIESFNDLPIDSTLLQNIKLSRYTKPTPVQKHGIPIALRGRDLMSCAQTGSGKTAAFLLPIISKLLKTQVAIPESITYERKSYPRALIMSPTRELALQIFTEARKFAYMTNIRPVVVYGGKNVQGQLQELNKGVDILVATPGRLMDMTDRGMISFKLIEFLVLDEADRMLDMGFEPQIRSIVETYDMPKARQTLMFSATFPRDIRDLARSFLNNYLFLTIGRVGSTINTIKQVVEEVEEYDKKDRLVEALKNATGLSLIFVEKKRTADELEDFLSEGGYNSVAIHGDRTQNDREFAMRQFKAGRAPILIATDVAARGWDVPNVHLVVNYDMPKEIDSYVHRIGRTGRAGQKGTALSFYNRSNSSITSDLVELLREADQPVPDFLSGNDSFSYGGGGRGRGGRGRGRGGRGGGRFDNDRRRDDDDDYSSRNRDDDNGADRGYGDEDRNSAPSWGDEAPAASGGWGNDSSNSTPAPVAKPSQSASSGGWGDDSADSSKPSSGWDAGW